MPEKPEVITVSKTLEKIIIGKTIKKVDVYWDNIIIGDKDEFKKSLVGVLIPNLECGFYSDILHEIMQQMSSYNFQVVFIPNPENKYTLNRYQARK